jgi:branched-chain amino acid aminotransferase
VIYHHNGFISESSRSNIFVIKNGKIATPDQNILHGITRKRVLELDPTIEIRPISFEELLDADELFMTATTKKILPVTMIDDKKIGLGIPGSRTIQLMSAFAAMEKKSILV